MSKLGAHVQPTGPRNGYGDFCRAKPAVCLLRATDPTETAELSGGHTITIFRHNVYQDAPAGIDQTDVVGAILMARKEYPKLKAQWEQNPADYYTTLNEPGGHDLQTIPNYVGYELEMLRLADADGYKLCVLNLAWGTPDDGRAEGGESNGEIEVWKHFYVPVIRQAAQGGHIYGRHGYSDLSDPSSQRPFEEHDYLVSQGIHIGIAITELGVNDGSSFPGVDEFTRLAKQFDVKMRQYPYIIGGCLWTLGNFQSGASNWYPAIPSISQHMLDNPSPRWELPDGQPEPEPENLLVNASFEDGWTNLPPGPGSVINQQPNGWNLSIVPVGQQAWDFIKRGNGNNEPVIVTGYPECVHKDRLPPDEMPGGSNPLILDGQWVYKIFGRGMSFAVELNQTITGLIPGRPYSFLPPLQVHYQDVLNEPDDVEIEVKMNDLVHRIWATNLADRTWVRKLFLEEADENGEIFIRLRFVTKWANSRDFFMDDWSLQLWGEEEGDCRGKPRVQYKRWAVLMPPNKTMGWWVAAVKGAYPMRGENGVGKMTVSGSADDAGIGDLDEKGVIVINPQEWHDDGLSWWYDEHYPGTKVLPLIANTQKELEEKLAALDPDNPTELPPDPPDPEPSMPVEFGIHDLEGARWYKDNGLKGFGLHSIVCREPTLIDFTHYEQAGIKMLVRLNWGYKPDGTFPRPSNLEDQREFIHACQRTINESRGVWGWIIGNEFNNPNEFPDAEPLSPVYVSDIYNQIWDGINAGPRVTIGAVDPYYGPSSDNRSYWSFLLSACSGFDFLTYHPKTQQNDPNLIFSDAKFSHPPLAPWQYLHFKSHVPLMNVVPAKYRLLPVVLTECNPQERDDGSFGWEQDTAGEWIDNMARYAREWNASSHPSKITACIVYRMMHDEWGIHNIPSAMSAMRNISQ